MKKRTMAFKIDNIHLIPKIQGNKLTLHTHDDFSLNNPIVIIQFENGIDLRNFAKKICFESNISYYLNNVEMINEISIN